MAAKAAVRGLSREGGAQTVGVWENCLVFLRALKKLKRKNVNIKELA